MGKQPKKRKLSETRLIGGETRALANKLHRDEHIIVDKHLPTHTAEYYYHMACWIYGNLFDELQEIKDLIKKKRKKRKPSEYNLFVSEKMKEGMTLKEAVAEYKTSYNK